MIAADDPGAAPTSPGAGRPWRASTYDPDGLVNRNPGPVRRPHLYPAEPGDGCHLSRCGAPAAYRIGWADPGRDPTVTIPYCARHGEPHKRKATNP